MNDRPILSDDTIRGLLEARAERADTAGLLSSVRLAAAATPQRRAGRIVLGFGPARGPMVASAAGVVSVAVLVVAFGLATGWRISSGVTPTAGPASSASTATFGPSAEPSIAALQPIQPLTVDQLNTFMAMNSQSPAGRQLVITGTIGPNAQRGGCTGPCTAWVLEGSNPTLYVQPVGDAGPGPWSTGGKPLTGAFAATMGDGFVLHYQGPVTFEADGGMSVTQLPDPSGSGVGDSFRMVQGWLGGMIGSPFCPMSLGASQYPGTQYGCGAAAYLSDGPFQPWIGKTFEPPTEAVRVQNDAFMDFAPIPPVPGTQAPPQQATFLLRAVAVPPCPPREFCAMATTIRYYWSVVARVGPWPFPTTAVSPAPSPSAIAQVPVLPVTIDQLNAQMALDPSPLMGRVLVITGTLEIGLPQPSCAGGPPPCGQVSLAGSNPRLIVRPTASLGARPWANGLPLSGPFAAVMADAQTLDYQGTVSTTADGGAWLPNQLPDPSTGGSGVEFRLVQGWLGGMTGSPSCPFVPDASPYPGPQYGCGAAAYLSDGPFQPWTGNTFQPPDGLRVQNGAFADFAPVPPTPGAAPAQQATFLLRSVHVPTHFYWSVVARVDPWPAIAVGPTPAPPTCAGSAFMMTFGGFGGAGGSTYTPLRLTLTDGQPCSLLASPGVTILDSHGQVVVSAPSSDGTGTVAAAEHPPG